jgi:hypothetical protein
MGFNSIDFTTMQFSSAPLGFWEEKGGPEEGFWEEEGKEKEEEEEGEEE